MTQREVIKEIMHKFGPQQHEILIKAVKSAAHMHQKIEVRFWLPVLFKGDTSHLEKNFCTTLPL